MYCELNLYQICKIIQLILKYIKQRMLEFQLKATKKKRSKLKGNKEI